MTAEVLDVHTGEAMDIRQAALNLETAKISLSSIDTINFHEFERHMIGAVEHIQQAERLLVETILKDAK